MDIDKDQLKKLIQLLLADCERLQSEGMVFQAACAILRTRYPEVDAVLSAVRSEGNITQTVSREYARRSEELLRMLDESDDLQRLLKEWPGGGSIH